MDYNFSEIFHCFLIFNNQHEPIFTLYDDYIFKVLIQPHLSRSNRKYQLSLTNILMQMFSPILASQSAMTDNLKMKFNRIKLMNDRVFVIHRSRSCTLILLLSDNCPYRNHASIIGKKLENIEWIITSFYGLCWSHMKFTNDKWLKVIFKELLLMDQQEFNINFSAVERLDLQNNNKKLTEKVYESLTINSRYLKQINEKRLKHQLILVGSKLYTLYSNETANTLRQKHILLFIIICNAVFNRYSRIRDIVGLYKNQTDFNSANETVRNTDSISSSDDGGFLGSKDFFSKDFDFMTSKLEKEAGSSTADSIADLDPFVLWVENKEGFRYRIVRLFLNFSLGPAVPCNIHLIKLARNVVYVGVEEDVENNVLVANLDKSIRLLRKIINEQIQRNDTWAVLRGHVGQAIEKLIYLNIKSGVELRNRYKQILKELYNYDTCERLLKELCRLLETIYIQYYISSPIKVNDRLCKSILKCFLNVRKEILEFVSILSVKAIRNIPLTSLYSLYPGLIHFMFAVKKLDNFLIAPTAEPEAISDSTMLRIHFWIDIARKLAMGSKIEVNYGGISTNAIYNNGNNGNNLNAASSSNIINRRQIELLTDLHRVVYLRRIFLMTADDYTELELVLIYDADTLSIVIKKHFSMLVNQFLGDLKNSVVSNGPNLLSLIA